MNYRHAFHAGNIGDVLKHAALLALLRALQLKDGALTILDTHAGRGLYDLDGSEAGRTNEADLGIRRVFASSEFQLGDYINLVAAFNPKDTLQYYPGSPALLAHTARPQDTVILNELHPEEAQALRGVFARDKQVIIHERDAYEVWQALTPTATPRGLVVVDPPFEKTDEFQKLAQTLEAVHRKWSHGVTMIWYPVKNRSDVLRFGDALKKTGIPKMLQVEHLLYDDAPADRFNGSGLIIVNPPYAFTQELPALLEAIRRAIALPGHHGQVVNEWLAV